MIVEQTKQQLMLCARWEAEVLANIPDRPNYTGVEASRRYFIGYRGELAACAFLSANRLFFEHEVRTNGRSQTSEITMQFGGRTRLIEVKCAGDPAHRWTLWPKAQGARWDILIGCHLFEGIDSPRCEVRGWIGQRDMLTTRVESKRLDGKDNHCVPWEKLRPMFRLPQAILRAQTTEEWIEDYTGGDEDGTADMQTMRHEALEG